MKKIKNLLGIFAIFNGGIIWILNQFNTRIDKLESFHQQKLDIIKLNYKNQLKLINLIFKNKLNLIDSNLTSFINTGSLSLMNITPSIYEKFISIFDQLKL